MDATRTTTASGKTVKLRTRNVGCHFGTVGQVVARNGRVIFEGPTRPYGFTAAALSDAEGALARL